MIKSNSYKFCVTRAAADDAVTGFKLVITLYVFFLISLDFVKRVIFLKVFFDSLFT